MVILIVYNADEGLFAALRDAVHKVVSPATYPCSLCAVSYGAVLMRPEWRRFLGSLPFHVRFLHRQDFHHAHPTLARLPLPAILLDEGAGPQVLLDADTLQTVGNVDALIATLQRALAERRAPQPINRAYSASGRP